MSDTVSIVSRIKTSFDSPLALASFINDNARELFLYFNATNPYLDLEQDVWYELVVKHSRELRQLDYDNNFVKAFIVGLFDYACRFGLSAMVTALVPIVEKNHIVLSKRLEAEKLLFYPKPSHNIDLIDSFDRFCELLQQAWDERQTDIENTKAALLLYYKYVIDNLPSIFVDKFREKYDELIGNHTILQLISDEIHNAEIDSEAIGREIDRTLDRNDAPIVAKTFGEMIETDTDYADEVKNNVYDFSSLRKLARDLAPCNAQLQQRGVEIIDNPDDLLIYLKNYGNMHFAKVASAIADPFPKITEKIDIIDWGCGQAIATLAFIEKFGSSNINMIVLIEPSELALKRAALHCRKFAPDANVITICRKFDDIREEELPRRTSDTAVNLLSNVLDMDFFSHEHLIGLIESRLARRNFFVCASPYTDDAAVARLDDFKSYFNTAYKSNFKLYRDVDNSRWGRYWLCNVQYSYNATSHGESQFCNPQFNGDGCSSRWTRVVRVFSVG